MTASSSPAATHALRHNDRGFTLVELAIVLIIIGLVAGSIVAGTELINTASVRTQARQLETYRMAFTNFLDKYGCVPGDCINATTFLGNTDTNGNTIPNGDGNGVIDTANGLPYDDNSRPAWNASPEMYGVFQHLAMAKMIDFVPSNPTSRLYGVSHPTVATNPNAGFFLGASYNFSSITHPQHQRLPNRIQCHLVCRLRIPLQWSTNQLLG